MSSFKNFAPMLSNLQRQADGRGTLEGSSIDDFLSIAGYGDGGGGGGGGGVGWDIVIKANGLISSGSATLELLSSSGSAADLYDKLFNGDPVSCVVYQVTGSGYYWSTDTFICKVEAYSTPNQLHIDDTSWSPRYLCYDGDGVRYGD